jgi:hypothetical protein
MLQLLVVELVPDLARDRIQFVVDHDGGRYVGFLRPGMPEWGAAYAACEAPRPVLFAGPAPITIRMGASRVVELGERYPTGTSR